MSRVRDFYHRQHLWSTPEGSTDRSRDDGIHHNFRLSPYVLLPELSMAATE
jgi:hypothetical protein